MESNRRRSDTTDSLPKLYQIFHCEVATIQPYGIFVKIPGYRKNGLVHKSQMATAKVDDPSDMVEPREKVYCKVISIDFETDKIGMSMKVVNQTTGQDLDPGHVQTSLDEQRRKTGHVKEIPRIELGAVLDTTCKKCGGKGHLAKDCFHLPGSKTYDLLPGLDYMAEQEQRQVDEGKVAKAAKKQAKKLKKEKKKMKKEKKKQKKKLKRRRESSSSDTDSSSEDEGVNKRKHKMKKKRSKQTNSSADSSEDSSDSNRERKHRHSVDFEQDSQSRRHHRDNAPHTSQTKSTESQRGRSRDEGGASHVRGDKDDHGHEYRRESGDFQKSDDRHSHRNSEGHKREHGDRRDSGNYYKSADHSRTRDRERTYHDRY